MPETPPGRVRQKKAERRKKTKTWKHERPPQICGGFVWPFFTTKLGRKWNFWIKGTHQVGSPPHIYIYIYMAKASFSAYLKLGKSALFDQKKHDQFWSSFLFIPLFLLCPKMAKVCCSCLSKRQTSRQKTRPPPYIHIYMCIYVYMCCKVSNWATFGPF